MHATLITAKEIGLWNALRVVRADLHKLCTSRGMSSFDFNAKVMRELGLPVGSQSGFESEMANSSRLNEFGAGLLGLADDGPDGVARSSPISAGPRRSADDGHAKSAGGNPKQPTQGQIAGRIKAEQSGARSLFERAYLGKTYGSWSYRGLVGVQRDGEVAAAIIAEIGEIGEDVKDREVIQLLDGSEERLRRALAAAKKTTLRAT